MSTIRLGSVSLDCADPSQLAAFWCNLLGGSVAFSSDSFVAVKLDHLWLTAVKVDDYEPPRWPDGAPPKQLHLDLAVDDLDHAEQEALRFGAVSAADHTKDDVFRVMFDPAGHPFCLTTQIPE